MKPAQKNGRLRLNSSVRISIDINESLVVPDKGDVLRNDQRSTQSDTPPGPSIELTPQDVRNIYSFTELVRILLKSKKKRVKYSLIESILKKNIQELIDEQKTIPSHSLLYRNQQSTLRIRKKLIKPKAENRLVRLTAHTIIVKHALKETRNRNNKRTLLFEAVINSDVESVNKLINEDVSKKGINSDKFNILHVTDEFGITALHLAYETGCIDMIKLLVENGALIDIMNKYISKPTELLENILDVYIFTNGLNIQDHACKVTVNFTVLMSGCNESEQMKFMDILVNSGNTYGQRRLLLHPLVESFLYLKWKQCLPFFILIVLVFDGSFVTSLTMYIMSEFYYNDKEKEVPFLLNSIYCQIFLYCAICLNIFEEFLYISVNRRHYRQLETWIKISSMSTATILPYCTKYMKESEAIWPRHLASLAVLLSWMDMMFLLARIPKLGYYVLMFKKVAFDVIKVLFTFIFLFFGFAISFMIELHSTPPFEGPWSALVEIFVMMTSEFNYNELPSNIVIHLIFLSFLILAAISLMHLMVGVAINDLAELERFGNIMQLVQQVQILRALETLLQSNFFVKKFIPHQIIKKICYMEREVELSPGLPITKSNKKLPTYLRDTIFAKVHVRRKVIEEQKEALNYRTKIEEIYEAIVNEANERNVKWNNRKGLGIQPDDTLEKLAELITIQSLSRCRRRLNVRRKSQF